MKAVCAFCGYRNQISLNHCAQCGESLAEARREQFRLPWASWVPVIPVAAFLWIQGNRMQSALDAKGAELSEKRKEAQAPLKKSLQELEERLGRQEAEEEAKHRAWLRDERVISGALANERHAEEWSKRQKHEPAFASTLLEKTLVEVEQFGKDPSLAAESAIQKVAERVSPAGSRIEVRPSGSRFVVRVAFRLSAVTPYEAGSGTLHTSSEELRKQIEEATARVIRDLFDFCGSRGIERLSVSCNRAISEGPEGSERLRMRSLYRASVDTAKASGVANWRTLSLAQVAKLLNVEHDMTARIAIRNTGVPAQPLDPNEPLEF